jgi:hypothetical protein
MNIIGLYGAYNMWYISKRSLDLDNIIFYTFTFDDEKPPCRSRCHTYLEYGTPNEFLNNGREEYEKKIAEKTLLEMMLDNKPSFIRKFNAISEDIELLSHTHVKINLDSSTPQIRSLSDLDISTRRIIWDKLYPNVFDIVSTTKIEIEPSDYVFAVSSCITPLISNGGIMPKEERLRSTIEQLKSIRKTCPSAKIFLLESSALNFDDIERLYDLTDYIFLFEKNDINKSLASLNKSYGESYVIHSLLRMLPKYKLFFKFSGRYKLLNQFSIDRHSLEKPTFRITPKNITWSKQGVCESILYSIPYDYHASLLKLLVNVFVGRQYIDIEHGLYQCFCKNDDISKIHNLDELYVIGNCSGHPGLYNRV